MPSVSYSGSGVWTVCDSRSLSLADLNERAALYGGRFSSTTMYMDQYTHAGLDGVCVICIRDIREKNSSLLPCGHILHTRCLYEWLQHGGFCPHCRASFV